MTRAKDISKIVTDADLSGTLDVTGTVTAGGLTVGDSHTIGDDADDNLEIATSVGENLVLKSSGNVLTYLDTNEDQSTAAYQIYGDVTSPRSLLRVEETGDISFYEDTGTTPKLFWDASAERLGIGHSSPNVTLHVQGANVSSGDANHNVVIDDTTSMAQGVGGGIVFRGNYGSGLTNGGFIQTEKSNATSGNYAFDLVLGSRANGSSPAERMRIDSSGNVGIGTSSPGDTLEVNGIINIKRSNELSVLSTTATGVANFEFGFNKSGGTTRGIPNDTAFINMRQGYPIIIATQETERMRIDDGGHVTMPYQPAFQAVKTTTQSNIATGSDVTITLQVELFDQNADFSSNTFTAPVTGRYLLSTRVRLDDVDTAADYYILKIVTSNRNWITIMNPDFSVDGDFHSQELTVLADMDAGDTAYVILYQSGGTAQTDIVGDSSYSYFCGFLAC